MVDTFDEDTYNDEVLTFSTSGSDGDFALLESNQLKIIYEEGATDEDPDVIPKDDSSKEEILTSQFNSLALENIVSESIVMEDEETPIPTISITTTEGNEGINLNEICDQTYSDLLTDIEDFDHNRNTDFIAKEKVTEDISITDAEDVNASDEDFDFTYTPDPSMHPENKLDYGGTREEILSVNSPQSILKKGHFERSFSKSGSDQQDGLINVFLEKYGTTDHEEFDTSDEGDDGDEDMQYISESEDIFNRLLVYETVDISDRIRQRPVSSPTVTPQMGEKSYQRKGKTSKRCTRKKKHYSNLLSPRSLSPHLSDITDTEIVYSDSEDDNLVNFQSTSSHERKRRYNKHINVEQQRRSKQALGPITNNKMSFPQLEISKVHISQRVQDVEVLSESDKEDILSTYLEHIGAKRKSLHMEVAGTLVKNSFVNTDVEQFENSNSFEDEEEDDDETSQRYDTRHSNNRIIKNKQTGKDLSYLRDKILLTDTKNVEIKDELETMSSNALTPRLGLKGDSTEEDDFETSDAEYLAAAAELTVRTRKENNYEIHFIEVNGQSRPLAITPVLPLTSTSGALHTPPEVQIYTTEDIHEDSDVDVADGILHISLPENKDGVTDTKVFQGDDYISISKFPEPSVNEENSKTFPETFIEMVLMEEESSGRPVSLVLPSCSSQPTQVTAPRIEISGRISEIEDLVTDDDTLSVIGCNKLCYSPDIPDIDGGVIQSTDVMKVQKSKLKVLSRELQEPLTDTEDLFLSASCKRKRAKSKLKFGVERISSNIKQELTDTEDIVFSDVECNKNTTLAIVPSRVDPGTEIDDLDLSGEDDYQEVQSPLAVTPDCVREICGDSYTATKEGTGPFSDDARQSFLNVSLRPTMVTTSPILYNNFGSNTDTEDMMTSADEEGVLRSDTFIPYDAGLDIEDHSSVVYMKHTRKFDLDAPEEALHMKGRLDVHEALTDVEDLGVISEDEIAKPIDHLFVNDTIDQVCVCLNSEPEVEDSVCVCVNKVHGGLSLVWTSKNSTSDLKKHRGIHTVQLTSCNVIFASSNTIGLRRNGAPLKTLSYVDNVTNRMLKPRTCLRSNRFKCLLLEDCVDLKYLSFYLYIEHVNKPPPTINLVLKLSISLSPLGYMTKVVICKPNIFPNNIATLFICNFKILFLNREEFETNYIFRSNAKFSFRNSTNTLPIIIGLTTKTTRKIQDRAWSVSDILEAEPTMIPDVRKQRSSSVSTLISRFESLSSSTTIFDDKEKVIMLNNTSVTAKNIDRILECYPSCEESSNDNNCKRPISKTTESLKEYTKNTFKPIIPIVALKDKSVSPCRLEPSPIQDSPAFKAISKKAEKDVDKCQTLSGPCFLLTLPEMKKNCNSIVRPFKNKHTNGDLESQKPKWEVFELHKPQQNIPLNMDIGPQTKTREKFDSFLPYSYISVPSNLANPSLLSKICSSGNLQPLTDCLVKHSEATDRITIDFLAKKGNKKVYNFSMVSGQLSAIYQIFKLEITFKINIW